MNRLGIPIVCGRYIRSVRRGMCRGVIQRIAAKETRNTGKERRGCGFVGSSFSWFPGFLRGVSSMLREHPTFFTPRAERFGRRVGILVCALGLQLGLVGVIPGSPQLRAAPGSFRVEPEVVDLRGRRVTFQILVEEGSGERTVDRTSEAIYRSSAPEVVGVSERGLLEARSDGRTTLLVRLGNSERVIDVTVAETGTPGTHHFERARQPKLLPGPFAADPRRGPARRRESGHRNPGETPGSGSRSSGDRALGQLRQTRVSPLVWAPSSLFPFPMPGGHPLEYVVNVVRVLE